MTHYPPAVSPIELVQASPDGQVVADPGGHDLTVGAGLDAVSTGLLTEATKENYRRDAGRFIRDIEDQTGRSWTTTTWEDLALWWSASRDRSRTDYQGPDKSKPSTFNRRVVAVRRLFTEATRKGIVPRNVADGLKTLKLLKRPKGRLLTLAEAKQLLEACPADSKLLDLRDRLVVAFLLFTGIRVSELCRLQVDGLITVAGARAFRFNRKGGKEDEQKIVSDLALVLDAWLGRSGVRSGNVVRAVIRDADHEEQVREGRIARHTVFRIVTGRAGRAGLGKDVGPHDLRYTYTTVVAVRKGILAAAQGAGHEDPQTTMGYVIRHDYFGTDNPSEAVGAWLRGEAP